ncbi:Outer membrane beta-barrel assembly protein BamE [hydrothermal vent metagenome]|uniref:Outer membrane beta-barrel assembly protein BamE n=1 Tax=hydrothermal vent metagenome TaxID=652676 RepID=A0A3B0T2T6_9ZZZZ
MKPVSPNMSNINASVPSPFSLRIALRGAIAATAILTAACSPIRDYRGFVAQEDILTQVQIGMSRGDVEQIMGTPSATSSIDGKNFYYISSVFETTAFFEPEEIDRRIVAFRFDETDTVTNIANYGLKDGRIFDFISRKTPTRGKEITILQQMFGNIGRFGSGQGILNDRITGGRN